MYQNIKSINVQSLCKHKATLIFILNHSAFLVHQLSARLNFAQWKTIAPQGARHINIGNCLSQSEIRMAEKITLFKFKNIWLNI